MSPRTVTVEGFSLIIGNNYTANHFFEFLKKQQPEIVDRLLYGDVDLGDTIVFKYAGTYGDHQDTFAACDAFDFLR